MSRIDYDRSAATYHTARSLPLESLRSWRDAIERHLPMNIPGRVLDVGCGTGLFTRAMAIWFDVAVVGVDPSSGMLAEAVAAIVEAIEG